MEIANTLHDLFVHLFESFNNKKFAIYCFTSFISSFALYGLLLFIKKSKRNFIGQKLRTFLFINADKSDSNAIQIGGLVFSLVSMISIFLLFNWFPYLIDNHQWKILEVANLSWIGILIYGYIDDRFEIRPIVKLASQMGIILIFCLRVSNVVFHENSAQAFVVMAFFATAIVNGANLIDGLDTLTYKISSIIYFLFICLAAPILSLPTLFIAVTCFCNMTGFYFYNREPSKIHLGEIGVSSLGFSYIILSVLIFDGYKHHNPTLHSLTKALYPTTILIIELGISFSRRILNHKSPFKGDKLHLHHIFHEIKGYSASNSSTIIALAFLIISFIGILMMNPMTSIFSFIYIIIALIAWYLFVGWKYWFSDEIKLNLKIFEVLLIKKEVKVISSSALSDFRIVINKEELQKKDNNLKQEVTDE